MTDIKGASQLVSTLERAGEYAVAHAFKTWLTKTTSPTDPVFVDVPMRESVCVASLSPPRPEKGLLWFDPGDTSFYLAVGDRWIGQRAVQNYQFCAFLLSSNPQNKSSETPRDYLKLTRFLDQPSLDAATNFYHEEAQQYAAWAKKSLVCRATLLDAKRRHSRDFHHQILPQGMWTWSGDGSEFGADIKFAFSAGTLDLEQELPQSLVEAERLPFVRRSWTKAIDCGLILEAAGAS